MPTTPIDYIRTVVTGQFGAGEGRVHAADPARKTWDRYNRRNVYVTRCGRKNTVPVRAGVEPALFKGSPSYERCDRCFTLIEKEIAVGGLPSYRVVTTGPDAALITVSGYGSAIVAHVTRAEGSSLEQWADLKRSLIAGENRQYTANQKETNQ